MINDPVALDLDVAAIGVTIETTRNGIDVQIASGVAMLVEHEVTGVPHIHKVLAYARRKDLLQRPPIWVTNLHAAPHAEPLELSLHP
jgi:hypothetical protein